MRTIYLNAGGKPANGPEGYARQEITYRFRKHKSTWEYDAEGNPSTRAGSEYTMPGMEAEKIVTEAPAENKAE